MEDKVVLTIEKLKELCPTCADKVTANMVAKGVNIKTVSIKKTDYDWLMIKSEGRPPKEWWDKCIESADGKADDPAALCGWIWQNKGEGNDEAAVPDTEDALEAVNAKMKAEAVVGKLKKDIETVLCWRKFGKPLNAQQQMFANRVADDMIAYKSMRKCGVQLVTSENIKFIKNGVIEKGMQPTYGSDRAGPCEQDAVSTVHSKNGKFPRKTEEQRDVQKIEKPKSDKQPSLGEATAESGQVPKKTPDIARIKQDTIDGQDEGKVNDTAADEKIGHNPNEPMPKKMAEELISNAEWGVKIGAYTNVKEGIDRQLGRKSYQEFIDTDDKLKEVLAYLKSLTKE